MVIFSNNVEPANGFLVRYLHRKAVEAYQEKEQDSARHQALLRVLDWIPQLWYHLHTFLEKHSTSDFLIGEKQWTQGRLKVSYVIFLHLILKNASSMAKKNLCDIFW